jgi:hypothetical protein
MFLSFYLNPELVIIFIILNHFENNTTFYPLKGTDKGKRGDILFKVDEEIFFSN